MRSMEGFLEEGRLELSPEGFGKLRQEGTSRSGSGEQDGRSGDRGLTGAAEGTQGWVTCRIFEQKNDKLRFVC